MSVNKEVIETIRQKFLSSFDETQDLYHKNDLELIRTNDWWIERFVLVTKSEETALKAIVKCFQWRKSFGVNDFNDQYFPEEMYKIGAIVQFCKDKEDRNVLWTVVKHNHKCNEWSLLYKQFTVWQYEKLDRQTSQQGWAVVSDSTGSGLSNVDMDYNYFMIDVVQNYYPRGMNYMAVVDLPWILNATSKLLLAFMNEELRKCIKFIKKEELTNYLDPAFIPEHLKGSYNKDLIHIPEGVVKLENYTLTKFSAEQIKKIYSTFKAELK